MPISPARPSTSITEWQEYLSDFYNAKFTEDAARIILQSALTIHQAWEVLGFLTINTRNLLIQLSQVDGPLAGLKMSTSDPKYTGEPPWHEQESQEHKSQSATTVFGFTRPSIELDSILRAASAIQIRPNFHHVTPWHIALATITSQAKGFLWQLDVSKSSVQEATEVLKLNITKIDPDLGALIAPHILSEISARPRTNRNFGTPSTISSVSESEASHSTESTPPHFTGHSTETPSLAGREFEHDSTSPAEVGSLEERLDQSNRPSESSEWEASQNGPRPPATEFSVWRDYFEKHFSCRISEEGATILAKAAQAAVSRRGNINNLITVNTKDLLPSLTAQYGPLETLQLSNHTDTYTGRPPWDEYQTLDYEPSYERKDAFGSTRPSEEFVSVLETATQLAWSTREFNEVTEWHLAFALISSGPTGFKWQLEAQKSSLGSAAKVLRRNLRNREPLLEPLFPWSELDLTDASELEEPAEESDSNHDAKVWRRAFDKIRNPKDFKWSISCGQILDKLWHSHGTAASLSRQSYRPAKSFNPHLTPRSLFIQCLIHGAQKNITEQDLLARIANTIGKDEESLRKDLQTELHRGPDSTNESNQVATEQLLDVIRQAQAIRDDVGNDDYVSTRHLIAALLLPGEGGPTGGSALLGYDSNQVEQTLQEFTAYIQSSALNSFPESRSKWDLWLNKLPRNSSRNLDDTGPQSSESKSPQTDDLDPPDSAARRGPRSLLPHHPPDASPFRRLVEPERNQFDEFLRKANLNLSYACWNANVIAWEDTAALGDTDRAPIVTCASVFIGFLDTGLAESQMAAEGSLAAALARTMEMSSERLTRFRIEASLASQPKEEASLVHGDEGLLLLWQHAFQIASQCTEDKIIAARHLLAAFIFVFENDPKIQDDLANLGFNPTISISLLQEHLSIYETANHPGWRAFFQKLGVAIYSTPIAFGKGITASRYNSLCLGIEKTSAAIAEIFKSARNPQSLPDSKGEKRERVSDFVFALYGPWGRGKSTLMSSVAASLTQDPDTAATATDAKEKLTFEWLKSPWRWLSGVLFGYPKVTKNYAALEFSAWKYPSRPEVWVHLYERVRELAETNSLLQRLRLSFRLGLLESGWWPLLFGFILLALARLPLADLAGGIWKASGWLGCLLIAGFFLRVFRIGALVGQRYMKIPSHADKLGLQAVIGRDLKNLLQVWITPPNTKHTDEKLSTIDFRWLQKGWWLSFVIVALIVFSVWQACHSIQKDHMLRIEKAAALQQKRTQLPSTTFIQAKVHFPLGELNFNIPATYPVVQAEVPRVVIHDPFWIYSALIVTGALAIIAGWIITRPPKQHETLLLTVDDLDRCESDQMLAVIDSLRLFLDDQEMSQRLQMAMLLDRSLLQESLRTRIKQAGIDDSDNLFVRSFYRTHREKVFLCEFSMPPLQEHERNELLKSLFPNAEPPPQITATPATAGQAEAGLPERPKTKFQSTPIESHLSAVPDAQPKPEALETPNSSNTPKKPEAPQKTSRHEEAPASRMSEEPLSQSDTSALVHAISRIPSTQLTPRSMLMLKVRFELVRLLLKHQLEDYEPDDATLSGIATSLVEDLFPGLPRYSAPLPKEVKAVVDQVTSN